MLRISLLGVLRIEVDGMEIEPPASRGARLLLAMLAVERRPHSRAVLAGRLWPGVLDQSARASLRNALAQLRAALGDDASHFVDVTRERVALAGPGDVWTDVGELERLLDAGEVHAALVLWSGELLTGLEDDWVGEQCEALRQRLSQALDVAAGDAEAGGDVETALRLTRQQVALDPLAEEPHRTLIRRLAHAGDGAAALAAYDRLSHRLRQQLRAAPSATTRELAAAVRAGSLSAGDGAKHEPGGNGAATPAGEATPDRIVVESAFPRSLDATAAAVSPFVGREAQLASLRERWRQLGDGTCVAVVIGGEAGIGKTRLAAEFAGAVHREGALVLYGRCDEGLAVPYQPFVQALRPHARAIGLDRLHAELGHLAPELRRLLPELAGLGDPLHADPESQRFALFEAVAALVAAITDRRRVLLVLDDLHWATRPTLLLLRHLIRSERPLGMFVLATYRETELDASRPLAHVLADLHRDGSVQRLSIGGLDEPAIAALLEAAVGQPLDERTSQLVHVLETQTGGNPLFLRELLAHVAESGERLRAGGVTAAELDIPEGLRQVIDQRVMQMSAPAARTLRVAAVAGPTFPLVLMEHVLGERSGVLDALDEAVAAGLLTEAGRGDYAFAHALVRQAIYAQLSSARRMRLHHQLGEAFEALGDTPAHVEALAYHFAEAAADGQAAKAAAYALVAGRSATARLGYVEAAAHYERGLDALALSGQPNDPRRCELLLALGEASWGAGELDKARQAYAQAAGLAEKLGDSTALARAALGFCGPPRVEVAAAVTQPVARLLERALAALSDDDSTLRARLLGRLAAYAEIGQRKPLLADQARQMARRVADKATLADVLANTLWATRGPDAVHQSLVLAGELGRVAEEVGDRQLRALAHRRLAGEFLELGDIDAAERELDALRRLAETPGERYIKWLLAGFRANQAHLSGKLDDCERLAHEALGNRFEGHDEVAVHAFRAQMVHVRREQGRFDELVEPVARFAAQYPEFVSWRCLLALIYAELQRTVQARHELEALAHADFRDLPRDGVWLPSLAVLCGVVAFLGDARRARLLHDLLSPYADRCVVAFGLICGGSAARAIGLLETTLHRFDDAARHFELALEVNAQIRSPLWVAHTHYDYASMLLRRNGPGDRETTLELLRRSLASAERLGLTALADKARRLTRRAGGGLRD
jgi:DNA-binding SARP family transcriptional activator/tetratricopeptide (TPR) repeat protein